MKKFILLLLVTVLATTLLSGCAAPAATERQIVAEDCLIFGIQEACVYASELKLVQQKMDELALAQASAAQAREAWANRKGGQ